MANWLTFLQPPRQGTRHVSEGVPCQDCAVIMETGERIVAVVSDGVSQYRYSECAAEAAAHAAAEFLLNCSDSMPGRDMKRAIIDHCRAAVIRRAGENALPMTAMDCTLLFILMWRDGSRAITGQLGDGAICAVGETGARLLEAMDVKRCRGANFTSTLLSADAETALTVIEWPEPDAAAFLVTTDGLEKEIYARSTKVRKQAEWYVNLIAGCDEMTCRQEISRRWDMLTAEEGFGFTDDMSLAAIVQAGATVKLPQDPNWLCVCGGRNRLESTVCSGCGKDFMRLYRGVRFKDVPGGKAGFFAAVNQDEAEEMRILKEHCDYPDEETQPMNAGGTQTPDSLPEKTVNPQSDTPGVVPVQPAGPEPVPEQELPACPETPACETPPEPVSRRKAGEEAPAEPRAGFRAWLRRYGQACGMMVLLAALLAAGGRCAALDHENAGLTDLLMRTEQEYVTARSEGMLLESGNTQLQQELERLQRSSAALRAELESLSRSLESAESEMKRLGAENQRLRRDIAAADADAARRESELQQLNSRVEFLNGDNRALEAEIARLIGELQQLQAECDRLRLQAEAQAVPSGGDPSGDMQELQAETMTAIHPAET